MNMTTPYLAGDVIARRKGLVMHKGIALGDGQVLHNMPSRGEHISSEAEFLSGRSMVVYITPLRQRQRALQHADQLRRAGDTTNRGYHLFTNNCEHTVNRLHKGRAESPQLKGWIAGFSLAAVAFLVTRHPGVAAAGFAIGRRLGGIVS